jgi:stage III sporulation protein AE
MGSIKSVVGVFGLLILILMMAVPLLKLAVIGGIYKLTAALAEPVADIKIADGLNEVGNIMISLASILFFTSLLFIIFITTIMGIGGTG